MASQSWCEFEETKLASPRQRSLAATASMSGCVARSILQARGRPLEARILLVDRDHVHVDAWHVLRPSPHHRLIVLWESLRQAARAPIQQDLTVSLHAHLLQLCSREL